MLPPEAGPGNLHEALAVAYNVDCTPLMEDITSAQQLDARASKLARQVLNYRQQDDLDAEEESLLNKYNIVAGALGQRDHKSQPRRIYVPVAARSRVLYEYHDSPLAGHPGAEETLRAIQDHHRWPKMKKEVEQYVRSCHICACAKRATGRSPGLRPHVPSKPWQTVAVDLMGPYPVTARQRRCISVITDLFSHGVEAFAINSSDARTIVEKLENEVFSRWGYPEHILKDMSPDK